MSALPRSASSLRRPPGVRTLAVLLALVAGAAGCASLGSGGEADGPGPGAAAADTAAPGDSAAEADTAAAEALQAAIDSAENLRDSVLAVLRARRAAGDSSAAEGGEGRAASRRSDRPIAEEGPSGPVRVTDVDSLRALGPVYTPYDVPPVLLDGRLEELLRATILPVVRRHGLEPDEWARFWVLVDREGRVVDHRVHLGSGHAAFDDAAAAAARVLRYRPARRDDEPVPVWVLVRISLLMGRG